MRYAYVLNLLRRLLEKVDLINFQAKTRKIMSLEEKQ